MTNDLFSYFSKTTIKSPAHFPFKDHDQFPMIVDILIRKDHHHISLKSPFSKAFHLPFLEAFTHYLQQDNIPLSMRNADCIYINLSTLAEKKQSQQTLIANLQQLNDDLLKKKKYVIIVLSGKSTFFDSTDGNEEDDLLNQLENLFVPIQCRFILWNETSSFFADRHHFTQLNLTSLTKEDINALLEQHRALLENFHHVIIPDELLTQAYTLTERYLSVDKILENAFLLLDSSAGRTSSLERLDNQPIKPILTLNTLLQVLSRWTKVPVSGLLLSKFKASDFIQHMQEHILGQDHAIHILAQGIEAQSTSAVPRANGVFAAYLFAGPSHSGKRACYIAFAEQLFKKLHMLYIAKSTSSQLTSLAELRLLRHTDQQLFMLKDVIKSCPYAIIVIENIDEVPSFIRDGLQEILENGFLEDTLGQNHSFRHSILILTTTCGTKSIKKLNQTLSLQSEVQNMDLVSLIMNDKKQYGISTLSSQEVIDAILPEIKLQLPAFIYQNVNITPFFPLSKNIIEKMMHLKLTSIKKSLHAEQGIQLDYAPEILHYLSSHALQAKLLPDDVEVNIDRASVKLTHTIEQAIEHKISNKLRMNHLFLQLNGAGTLLRWEWLSGLADKQGMI